MKRPVSSEKPQSSQKRQKDDAKSSVDDALEVAEVFAEEVGGIGVARRLYEHFKRRLSREFIQRIEKLEERQEELLATNAFITRAGNEYVVRLDELNIENDRLRRKLEQYEALESDLLNSTQRSDEDSQRKRERVR